MRLVEGTLTVADTGVLVERLGEVGNEHDCAVQAFDARYVAGRDHLDRAATLADRAIERGENVARDRAVEILLYAAGRRQIDRALEMGIDEGEQSAVVLVDAGDGGGDETDAAAAVEAMVDEPTPAVGVEHADEARLQAFFGVTDAERAATDAALADLVCERVALLDVEK
ncbi:KEOPS complex component [Halobacteriales archaeon QS_9_68_17]|nr:MAG: KEOPS complex component [Halobacteriales archaeon QS_9_68_17]